MRRVPLPGTDEALPVVGQGTWSFGARGSDRGAQAEALRLGIGLGMTLIDTAEYYAAGGAEEVVGEAVADCRADVFLVTKVWPAHASPAETRRAVRASLRRLRTAAVDAVLVHWPPRPALLPGMLSALAELQADGCVRHVGVSNFDAAWLAAAEAAAPPGLRLAFDQVPYALPRRGVEAAVLPRLRASGRLLLAYSPLGHGHVRRWAGHPALAAVARARNLTPAQVALAFLCAEPGVVAIPKAGSPEHVRANAAAGDVRLSEAEIARLRAAFPRRGPATLPVIPPATALFRAVLWLEAATHGPRRRPG